MDHTAGESSGAASPPPGDLASPPDVRARRHHQLARVRSRADRGRRRADAQRPPLGRRDGERALHGAVREGGAGARCLRSRQVVVIWGQAALQCPADRAKHTVSGTGGRRGGRGLLWESV